MPDADEPRSANMSEAEFAAWKQALLDEPDTPAADHVLPFKMSCIEDTLAAGARRLQQMDTDLLERRAIIASLVGPLDEAEHYLQLLKKRNETGIKMVVNHEPRPAAPDREALRAAIDTGQLPGVIPLRRNP